MLQYHCRRRTTLVSASLLTVVTMLAACTEDNSDRAQPSQRGEVTVTNCGKDVTFPQPATGLYVVEEAIISMLLEIDAGERIAAVASLDDDKDVLSDVYGDSAVESLHSASDDYPTLENIVAQKPDVMVGGWGYGFDRADNVTPESLNEHDIAAYTLSESCRRDTDSGRGIMPPWKAMLTDIKNLGEITNHQKQAKIAVNLMQRRLSELNEAPQASDDPTVFMLSTASKKIGTAGSSGAPQAIIDAAGGKNATEDINDTYVDVSWERLAAADPDLIAFVDYPDQSREQKVRELRKNPGTKDLQAVKEDRFINLPLVSWSPGPLSVTAAEHLRKALEQWDLVPDSDIELEHDLTG